ncbi:MAG TPA: hypothetical protein VMC02_03080 [Steroidobacteraceae bacterium]|nr:hypothetical protein [Steroidobacteraceae bacterium]
MLRKALLLCTLVLAGVGVWLLGRRLWAPGFQALGVAALLFLGIAFENWRYRTGPAPPGATWQRTDEKFADPVSGEEMQVEYDPVSGARRYVPR